MSFFGPKDYKPKTINAPDPGEEIGWIRGEFESFEMNPKFKYFNGSASFHQYPQVSPITPSQHVPIDTITRRLISTMWKRAEPATGAKRSDLQIGRAGTLYKTRTNQPIGRSPGTAPETREYHAHVPAAAGDSAFAKDWKFMDHIPRTDAFTFRGDSRGPAELMSQAAGFWPPSSRTDRFYLEGPISEVFISYMQRRHGQTVTKAQFLTAVDHTAGGSYEKQLLVDYLMWRKIMEGESFHLGRMIAQECLKGYISTSRNPAIAFGFGGKFGMRPCWVYVTAVRGGFKVPASKAKWGSAEQEIAQWGPIPPDRIVGFRKVDKYGEALSPIYMRRSFRKKEPKAFEAIFNMWSGERPTVATT